jgi:hypothetical protein
MTEDFRDASAEQEAEGSAERDESVTGRDAGPIDPEGEQAAEGLTTRPGVAEHYQEMTEKGAHAKGEGQLP